MDVRRWGVVVAVAGLLLPTLAAASNGYFSHGFGTANKAMAGAGVALPTDAMGVAINPALMAHVGNRLDVGLAVFLPSRGFTANPPSATPPGVPFIPPGIFGSDNAWFAIPHLGWNKMLDGNTAIGISIGGNGGMNTSYPTAVFANFAAPGATSAPTGIDLSQLFLGVSYAKRITPRHTLAIAPVGAVQRMRAEGLEPFQGLSLHPGNVTNRGYSYSYGAGIKVGWLGRMTERLSLGVSLQSRIYMTPFDKYKGLLAEEGDFDIPPILQAGLAYQLRPNLTIALDVQRIRFGDIASLANSNDTLLTPGTIALGDADGLGFGWQDMTVWKAGVQWRVDERWTVRGGFSDASDVLSGGQALFNILAPATVTKHATLGFSYRLNDRDRLDFSAMHAFDQEVHGTNPNTPFQTGYLKMHQTELELSWSRSF